MNFEQIQPWNGQSDTGKDARLKIDRNFKKVGDGIDALDVQLNNQNTGVLKKIEDLDEKIDEKILEIKNNESVFNVTQKIPLQSGSYYTSATARAAVPTAIRKIGLILTYQEDASTWKSEQYAGTDINGWTTASNWRHPEFIDLGIFSTITNLRAKLDSMTNTLGVFKFDASTNKNHTLEVYYSGIKTVQVLRGTFSLNNPINFDFISDYSELKRTYDGSTWSDWKPVVDTAAIDAKIAQLASDVNDIKETLGETTIYLESKSTYVQNSTSAVTNLSGFYPTNAAQQTIRGVPINAIRLNIAQIGSLTVVIGKNVGNISTYTYSIKKVFQVTGLGMQTLEFDSDFTLAFDEWLGVQAEGDTAIFKYGGTGSGYIFLNNTAFSPQSNRDIGISVMNVQEGLISDVEVLEEEVKKIKDGLSSYLFGNILVDAPFLDNSLPKNLEYTGSAWSYANKEATPTDFGLNNALQSTLYANFNKIALRANVRIVGTSDIVGIYARPITYSQSGSIVVLDAVYNKLIVYSNWNGGNSLPTSLSEKVISFTILQNRTYRIEINKTDKDMLFQIVDLTTMLSDEIEIAGNNIGIPTAGYAFGKVGVFAMSGTPALARLQYIITGSTKPIVIFYGDSITEGYGILSSECYSYRALQDVIGYISAQSSCTSTNVIERLQVELQIFKPKLIHILIGTNEGNMTTWLNNIVAINSMIEEKGITPIFGCLPPNAQNTAQVTTWNAALIDKGYRMVRYDLALTTNNDGVNLDTSFFLSDSRHPNAEGGIVMLNRLKSDVPEMFEISA